MNQLSIHLVFLGVGGICPGSFVARGIKEMTNQGFGVQATQTSGDSGVTVDMTHPSFKPATCPCSLEG